MILFSEFFKLRRRTKISNEFVNNFDEPDIPDTSSYYCYPVVNGCSYKNTAAIRDIAVHNLEWAEFS